MPDHQEAGGEPANPRGSSGLSTGAGNRTDSSAAITNRKLTPLTMNTAGAPKVESRDAPSTGPTTRDVFICAEWSDTAPGRSGRLTSWGSSDE